MRQARICVICVISEAHQFDTSNRFCERTPSKKLPAAAAHKTLLEIMSPHYKAWRRGAVGRPLAGGWDAVSHCRRGREVGGHPGSPPTIQFR